MIKVGWNYGNKVTCPLCAVPEAEDTQTHLLVCEKLKLAGEMSREVPTTYDDAFYDDAFFKKLELKVRKREKMTEKTD